MRAPFSRPVTRPRSLSTFGPTPVRVVAEANRGLRRGGRMRSLNVRKQHSTVIRGRGAAAGPENKFPSAAGYGFPVRRLQPPPPNDESCCNPPHIHPSHTHIFLSPTLPPSPHSPTPD